MAESKRITIIDKDGNNVVVNVVPTQADPTKNGVVVCNADGSPVGGGAFLKLNQTTPQSVINGAPIMEGVDYDTTPSLSTALNEGQTRRNNTDNTLDIGMGYGVTQQVGQEMPILAYNDTGVEIGEGIPVYISGRQGHVPKISLARSDSASTSCIFGLTTSTFSATGDKYGFVTIVGYVRQIKTNYTGDGDRGTTWAVNDNLYVSKTVAGQLTNVEPTTPHHSDIVGEVAIVGAVGTGAIFVNIQRHKRIDELSDVDGTALTTSGQVLVWDQTAGYRDPSKNINNYELLSNKSTTTTLGTSNTLYPTQNAVKTYVDTQDKIFPVDINRYGFVPGQTTLTFDGTNTITIAPTGTTWDYYRAGLKYTITGNKSIVIPGTPVATGLYYIYIDATDGTITQSGSSWTLNDTKVPVATLYFNDTLTPKFVFCDERHTCLIDRRYHMEHHFIEGTDYVPGTGIPSGYTLNTATDAGNTFGVSEGKLFDEDLNLILSALTDPEGLSSAYFIPYRTASTTYVWATSLMPFLYDDLGGGTYGYIKYDNAGTLTASANNRYVNYYLFLSNARDGTEATQGTSTSTSRFMMIPGRASHTTTANAYAEAPVISAGFPVAEGVSIYQFTFNTQGVANTVKGRCRIDRVQAIQSRIISTSTILTADHNTLSNLQLSTTGVTYGHIDDQTQTIYGDKTFNSDVTVPDEAYGSGWNGSLEVPTKNAVYDKVETLLPLAGGTLTGTLTTDIIQLQEKSIKLDSALSADGTWCGITESGTGGETLAFGDLCYFKASDSKRYKAKADSTTTSGPVKLGFCVLAGASTTTEILKYGKIRADAKFPTLTIGGPAWVSGATAGEIVTTAPTTTDYVGRIVGYGNTADELDVNIDSSYYTYQ